MATQLSAHTTCLGYTHLLARAPCALMWLAHGGMLHPDWPAQPQPAAHAQCLPQLVCSVLGYSLFQWSIIQYGY